MCRLARTAATLEQTVTSLGRSLTRHQQKPAPFFGTVLSDAVDISALDATWHSNPDQQPQPAPDEPAPGAAPPATRRPPDPPNPSPPPQPTPPSAVLALTEPQREPDRPPHPAAHPAPDAATTPEWTRTRLDQGPGWSREVLRHRSSPAAGNGSIPGAAAR